MSISSIKIEPLVVDVSFTPDALHVVLADGREISVPLEGFPRLRAATPEQRKDWRLIGGVFGIRWQPLDDEISVWSLLAGNKRISWTSHARRRAWLCYNS